MLNLADVAMLKYRVPLLLSPFSSHRWVCVYPAYINAKKTLKEGRRIPRDKATTTPLCSEICDVCVSQGLNAEVEGKLYPREHLRDHIHYGRVRVQLKNEEGNPCNERVTTSVYGWIGYWNIILSSPLLLSLTSPHFSTLKVMES